MVRVRQVVAEAAPAAPSHGVVGVGGKREQRVGAQIGAATLIARVALERVVADQLVGGLAVDLEHLGDGAPPQRVGNHHGHIARMQRGGGRRVGAGRRRRRGHARESVLQIARDALELGVRVDPLHEAHVAGQVAARGGAGRIRRARRPVRLATFRRFAGRHQGALVHVARLGKPVAHGRDARGTAQALGQHDCLGPVMGAREPGQALRIRVRVGRDHLLVHVPAHHKALARDQVERQLRGARIVLIIVGKHVGTAAPRGRIGRIA